MDSYGCFRHTKEDAASIAEELIYKGSVVFAYSYDNVGAMIIFMSNNFQKLGVMPFGGQPEGRMYIGVHGQGCSHFSIGKEQFKSYFQEKLGIADEDALHLAQFYRWVCISIEEEKNKEPVYVSEF